MENELIGALKTHSPQQTYFLRATLAYRCETHSLLFLRKENKEKQKSL